MLARNTNKSVSGYLESLCLICEKNTSKKNVSLNAELETVGGRGQNLKSQMWSYSSCKLYSLIVSHKS